MKYRVLAALAVGLAAAPLVAETLTNDTIVALSKAGLGPSLIVAKIRSSPGSYQLDANSLVALKTAGVAEPVIGAMLEASTSGRVDAAAADDSHSADPRAPHAAGIYVLTSWSTPPAMQHLDATTTTQTKSGGVIGYALTYGIAKVKSRSVLPTPSARIKVAVTHPTFYFYFDQANASLSRGGGRAGFWPGGDQAAVTSPNEFSLVRLEVHGNSRETVTGSFNIGGSKSGVMSRDRIAFTYDDIVPGVFKVTPEQDLPPGEYAFVYAGAAGSNPMMAYLGGGGGGTKFFDFAISR